MAAFSRFVIISPGSTHDGAGMATRVTPTTAPLYEQDFHAWAKAPADLLRAGRYSDLDLEHLIEEVDDLGDALKRSVRSRIRTIIEHLLKLEHWPAQLPRGGCYDTVLAQRSDLLDELTAGIRREVAPTLPDLYDRARQRPPTSCPPPVPTRSTKSPATGCREGKPCRPSGDGPIGHLEEPPF
jgi:hypothetical protein